MATLAQAISILQAFQSQSTLGGNAVGMFLYASGPSGWSPVTGSWFFVTNPADTGQAAASITAVKNQNPSSIIGAYVWDGQSTVWIDETMIRTA